MQPAPRRPSLTPATLALLGVGAALLTLFAGLLAAGAGVFFLISSNRVLPGVSMVGVPLGGQTADQAAGTLAAAWGTIPIRDGDRVWGLPPDVLGLSLDAQASADAAIGYGRGQGSALVGILGRPQVAPIVRIDPAKLTEALSELAGTVNLPARNATIRMEGGELLPVAAVPGRLLDVGATLARLADPAAELADGVIDLVMAEAAPTVTDATPLLEKTRALLAAPLTVSAYNPVTNQAVVWQAPPEIWGGWLTTENTPNGVNLALEPAGVAEFLQAQAAALPDGQSVKVAEAVAAVQGAVSAGTVSAQIRVYNPPTQYTVRYGDTLGAIAWRVGVQMFLIQRANPNKNLNTLAPGEVITIPSKDDLLPLPVTPNKRIVVSIARQRMWVYEGGNVRWEWPASTGIPDSPTQPGIFQVTSHDGTAYAGNWNLYMPYFMSIYEAVPGFSNGIHGFPSRGGAQVLWENALGRRVTYGCVLISTANARALYEWAEDGVVVEIQP